MRSPLAMPGCLACAAAACVAATAFSAPAASADDTWRLPAPNACQPDPSSETALIDAPPFPFKTGDVIGAEQLSLLREFIPSLLWENRDQFFFEGMRLEVGACFADYSPPAFFAEATEKFAGQAKLLPNGGIENYTAGLPFPPSMIDRGDALAGLRWAWNYEHRYQGAGFEADFRVSDIVGAYGRAEPFIGHIYKAQIAYRADRASQGYRAKGKKSIWWVAGGKMTEPFNARGHAWRQFRDVESATNEGRTDDLHAYLAAARRVRRMSAAYVEGLYLPSFSVGVSTIGGFADGADAGGAASSRPDAVTPKRSGWEGLEIRPLRAAWKVIGVQDVLTPINATNPMYPQENGRDFGVWGVSFASDRWDLRRAVVLEAKYKAPDEERERLARTVMHFDVQTLAPLYYQSWDKRGETVDVGMYVGRFSEDRDDYARWPDDAERAVRVIDPVGAAFANVSERAGWRRESWNAASTPSSSKDERNKISVQGLTKGH
ncbi:MAG: DUF1329 domain-containing protein [Myxococcota bacterium]